MGSPRARFGLNAIPSITIPLLLGCSSAYGLTTTWTAGSGDWDVAGNWNNGVPTAGDDAVIAPGGAGVTVTIPAGVTAQCNNLLLGGANAPILRFTTNSPGSLSVTGDLTIENGAVLRCHRSSAAGNGTGRTITVGGSVDIQAGGSLNANGLGFANSAGPQAGSDGVQAGGGGHGGVAGQGSGGQAGGTVYGNAIGPSSLGSGGGNDTNDAVPGGAGGGAITMAVTNTLNVNGTLSADGISAGSKGAGGGAGGSLTVSANALTGSGTISAKGGSSAVNEIGGGGGGGRIDLSGVGTSTFSGSLSVAGGTTGSWASTRGHAGTIHFRSGFNLVIGGAGGFSSVEMGHDGSNAVDLGAGSMTINAGGLLELDGHPVANGAGVSITASAMTINAGGTIDADGMGFDGGEGPEAGETNVRGGGGGHGGPGGRSSDNRLGGSPYGSAGNPTSLGSGGGDDNNDPGDGGEGGGAIILNATGTLTVDGTITANGINGSASGAGGGAGGSISLSASVLAGSGTISAFGGNGAMLWAGGGGGGGRIDISGVGTSSFSGPMTVAGGVTNDDLEGATRGHAGTINFPVGFDLVIGGPSGFSSIVMGHDGNNQCYLGSGSLTVNSGGILELDCNPLADGGNGASAIITATNVTINAGGIVRSDGLGFDGGEGPRAGVTGGRGGGGGHGGAGGRASSGQAGGATNDSEYQPQNPGSGGGDDTNDPKDGGAGGGAIIFNVFDTMRVDGTVSANGLIGGETGAGGGAGGTIAITVRSFTGSGSLSANGGPGATVWGGGGGGGGRILIGGVPYEFNFSYTGTATVNGGLGVVGATSGARGTIFIDPLIQSAADQTFAVGDPDTAISPITIANRPLVTPGTVFNTTNDIRIEIPEDFNMDWDTGIGTATIVGSAAGKVSAAVTYAGKTLVIPVTVNWAPNDSITITGLEFTGFSAASRPNRLLVDTTNNAGSRKRKSADLQIKQYGAVTIGATIGEVGSVTIDQIDGTQWHTVNLNNTYVDPVVVMRPPTAAGADPVTIRLRNVTGTSFEWHLDEWEYQDGAHGTETVGYWVVESGRHVIENNTVVEAGKRYTSELWSNVTFTTPFASTPVVLSQMQTYIGPAASVMRHTGTSASRFQMRVQEEEAEDDIHAVERVGWIAISTGGGQTDGGLFEAGLTADVVTDAVHTINFTQPFPAAPVFVAAIQTFDGLDPVSLRYQNLTAANVEVFGDEEASSDPEVTHTDEVVGYFAMRAGDLVINSPPLVTLTGTPATYIEDTPPVILDGGATVTDPNPMPFDGGTLTVSITANGTANDALGINNQGTGGGQIGVSGANVTYGGTLIGTFSGGAGVTPLVVNLNVNATQAAVTALLQNVTFVNTSQNPSTAVRTVEVVAEDGRGGTSPAATMLVNITPMNDPPVAAPDTYTVLGDNTLVIAAPGVLANDSDIDGPILTAVLVAPPGKGTVTLNPNGSFTFVPTLGISGSDQFTYVASDGTAFSAEVTVMLVVDRSFLARPAASPPVLALGESTSLSCSPVGGSGVYVSFAWSGPGGFTSTLQNPGTATPPVVGDNVYTVIVMDSNGDTTTGSVTVPVVGSALQINDEPWLFGGHPFPPAIPFGMGVDLTSNPSGGTGNYVNFLWTGPGGFTSSVQSPGLVVPPALGINTYTVTVTDSAGLTSTGIIEVVVAEGVDPLAVEIKGGKVGYRTRSDSDPILARDKFWLKMRGMPFYAGDHIALWLNGTLIGNLASGSGLRLDEKLRAKGGIEYGGTIFHKNRLRYSKRRKQFTWRASRGDFGASPVVRDANGLSDPVYLGVFVDTAPIDGIIDRVLLRTLQFKVRVRNSRSGVKTELGRSNR